MEKCSEVKTLIKCVCDGKLEELQGRLEQSSDEVRRRFISERCGQSKMTAFHQAIEKGHEGIAKLLLEKELADVRDTDHHRRTALHMATSSENQNIGVIDLILRCHGVEVNALDVYGNTPLKLAAEKGHYETVELLMSKEADVNKADKVDNTPLHVAAKNGHAAVLELLLKNVEAKTIGKQTKDKYTALHHAVGGNNARCVALLLENGAGTCAELKNEQGRTPLDLANDQNNNKIRELLKDPNKAREFLGGLIPKAPPVKGCSVESDVCITDGSQKSSAKRKGTYSSGSRSERSKNILKDGVPEWEILWKLAEKIPTKWKIVGRLLLNWEEPKLQALDIDEKSCRERAYAMLRIWRETNGSGATYRVLDDALCEAELTELAETFCRVDS